MSTKVKPDSRKKANSKNSRLKNLARGQVGAANSHEYSPKFFDRSAAFDNGIRAATLIAGRALPPSQHQAFLEWLAGQYKLTRKSASTKRAVNYRALSNNYDTEPIDFAKQVHWSISRITFDLKKINTYKIEIKLLEALILLEKKEEAKETISRLERNYGATIQLAELKLAFEQFYYGLEFQKKLANSMRGGRQAGLVGFLIHYFSMRNEPGMSIDRYHKIVTDRISTWTEGSFKDYAAYKLLGTKPTTKQAIANVLRIEESHSVYDLSGTFFDISSTKNSEKSSPAVEEMRQITAIRELSIPSQEQVLNSFSNINLSKNIQFDFKCLSRRLQKSNEIGIEDLKILGGYAAALRKKFKNHTERKLLYQVAYEVANQLNLRNDTNKENLKLNKLASNFSQFPIFKELLEIIRADNLNWLDPWRYDHLSYKFVPSDVRLDTSLVGGGKSRRVLASALWLNRLTHDKKEDTLKRFVKFASRKNSFSGMRFIDVNIKMALCNALLALRNYPLAWNAMSNLAVEDEVSIQNIPHIADLQSLKWTDISSNSSLPRLAICLDLQSRIEPSDDLDGLKRYALEDFLEFVGVDRPSALIELNLNITRKEYVYFLRDICVPRTMQLLPALHGTADLNNERRAICSLLLQIDRDNTTNYNQEILNIIRGERVQQGLKLVDGSRIHVDSDVLAKKLQAELTVDFQRYRSLVNAGVGVADKFEEVLRNVIKPIAEQELLKIPENEADDLLLQIIGVIRDRFLFDEMNGFDSYLGRRIRHNSMTGTMRAPLSIERLITKFSTVDGRYERNVFWLEKIGGLVPENSERLDIAFEQFSSKFDAIGNDIKTRLFQVKSTEFPDGIFNIGLSSNHYHLLRSLAQQETKLGEFIAACFQTFWVIMTEPLNKARHIIRREAWQKIEIVYSDFKAIIATFDDSLTSDLLASIERSRLAVHKQLGMIVEWFHKREINEQASTWSLEEIIEICIEVCLITHRARNPKITTHVSGSISFASESLFVLSDILWIAIDNACMHSGFGDGVSIALNVHYDEEAKIISLDIENDLAEYLDAKWLDDNIASIAKDIETRRANESLRVEGRSGLKKIAAIAFSVKGGSCTFGSKNEGAAFGLSVCIPTLEFWSAPVNTDEEIDMQSEELVT